MTSADPALQPDASRDRPAGWLRYRRAGLWTLLVVLLVAAQLVSLLLTLHYRTSHAQAAVDGRADTGAGEVEQMFGRDLHDVLTLPRPGDAAAAAWSRRADALLLARPELLQLERRDRSMAITETASTRSRPPLFLRMRRDELDLETELACRAAQRRQGPTYSRSYFVPQPDDRGLEVLDLCVAGDDGFVTATFSLAGVLEQAAALPWAHRGELAFVESDGAMLAHAGVRGAGGLRATRSVDLPGATLQLRVDSGSGGPRLVPDLLTALVAGLSLTLFAVVVLLARDVRKRARVERELAESLAFRKAMEDSVVTGLRARDLDGRITYVNPAFCSMTGFAADELAGRWPPPYWPPEQLPEYERRQRARLTAGAPAETRDAFETVFVRKDGEPFPAMIFESPLVDGDGRHTGWMSTVLDLSAQRRVEEIARQQQERLQATARLATVGEMASLLSHELNQPLAAISAYATGSLNLMDEPGRSAAEDTAARPMLRNAVLRIAEQAERAGRVIKSVHDFVRRREQSQEAVGVERLIEAVLPLVRLQAHKSGTRVEVDAGPAACRVSCDRAMVEQVLLNLTRNGIQAMEAGDGDVDRVLTLRVRQPYPQWVCISVADRGPGIADGVAGRIFTPFFTTRPEGMGLGLSMCRTIIEQHGGVLDFGNLRGADGRVLGAEFRFTLPAASPAAGGTPRPQVPAAKVGT